MISRVSMPFILVSRAVTETKKMKIGDPLDRSVQHGPQNHKAHLDKLVEFCQTGLKEGARLLLGGKRADRLGLYMEPTIFCDVEDHMYIAMEESFGPIMVNACSNLKWKMTKILGSG